MEPGQLLRGMVLVSVCMLEEEKSFSYISREAERQSSLQKAIFFIDSKIVLSEKSPAAAPASGLWSLQEICAGC